MGLTSAAAAEQTARLNPDVAPDQPQPLERGHRRGTYVDRSRTDGRELRGIGKGIRGCMPHHSPGDSVAYLERMAKEEARAAQRLAVRDGMRAARARLRAPHTSTDDSQTAWLSQISRGGGI